MVKRVFNFVYQEVRGLHRAAYVIALFSIGSQLLAIVRDRLLAHTFGAGAELDLYYAAFRIPDLLFVLFASVLSIYVLLPFVNKQKEEGGVEAGRAVLSQIFSLFLVLYAIVAVVLAVAAPWYIPKLFPGFIDQQETLTMLLRVLLFQPLLLGLSNLCGVVTQMNHRFVLYAISPLLYNLGIIVGIAVLYPFLGLLGLVFGVIIGATGHLLIQVPFVIKSEYAFSSVAKINWKLVRQVLRISIPRALTLSVNQIVLLVFIGMASVMVAGSVSVFQFAFNLQSVPLAVIGMSYSVAAFPTLSNLFSRKDFDGFNRQLLTALRHIIFWSIPVVGLVVVLRAYIVRVLLGSGAFDWGDTRLTAAMLAIFVLSLVAQAALLLLIRAFYAGGKTGVPLLVALGSGAFSIALAILFQMLYQSNESLQIFIEQLFRLTEVVGAEVLVLSLAFMVGQFVQLVIMLALSSKLFGIRYASLGRLFIQSIVASLVGGVSAYATLAFLVDGINQETFIGIGVQGLIAGVMGLIGVILTYLAFRSPELHEVYRSFHTRIFKTDVIAPQSDQV